MGTFAGHVVPGSFFLLFSSWWAYSIFKRYFGARRIRPDGQQLSFYHNSVTFRCWCWPELPLEGMCALAAVTIGIAGETYTAIQDGHWVHLGNAQHVTMFAFFGLCGVLDVAYTRGPLAGLLPPDLDYVAAVLAFGVEAFLFRQHLMGRSPLDMQLRLSQFMRTLQVHSLLYMTAVACSCCTALELFYRRSLLPALGRAFFTMLQGSWFIQIAIVLYGPHALSWNHKSMEDLMMISLLFAWHVGVLCVIFLVLAATMATSRTSVQNVYLSANNIGCKTLHTEYENMISESEADL